MNHNCAAAFMLITSYTTTITLIESLFPCLLPAVYEGHREKARGDEMSIISSLHKVLWGDSCNLIHLFHESITLLRSRTEKLTELLPDEI